MRSIVFLLAGLLTPAILTAQLHEVWVGSYSGPYGDGTEYGQAVVLDQDGYAYVCGYGAGPSGSQDYITVKYNPATGETLWVRYYDGPGRSADYAAAIAVDNSGGVYVTGYSTGSGTSYDYATVKYNASDGSLGWPSFAGGAARYNGPGNRTDYAVAIAVDNSGGVYVTGYSFGSGTIFDYATIKYNASDGSLGWPWFAGGAARYNGPANSTDYAVAIAVDNSGGVYVTGYSTGSGTSYDYATVKYNASDGSLGWTSFAGGAARYNGPGNRNDYAYAIASDYTGGVYVTGYSYGSGTSFDYATIKYNASDGSLGWTSFAGGAARYNGPGNSTDYANAVAVDASGLYVTGHSTGSGTSFDYATVKYNTSDGSLGWTSFADGAARYNGPGNSADYANAVAVDASGLYVTGHSTGSGTSFDYSTVHYDQSNGKEFGTARYNGSLPSSNDRALSVATGPLGRIYVTGYCQNLGTSYDVVTIKYLGGNPDVGVSEIVNPHGAIDTLEETPQAIVRNYGTLTASFDVWFEIRDSATKTVRYLEKVEVTDLEVGGDSLVEFPKWDVPADPEGWYCATSWTEFAVDVDAHNDTARARFAVEAIQQGPPNWTARPDVPSGLRGRAVQHGAAMATDPQGLHAYLLKGNNTGEFYRYDPATGSWSELDPIPERGRDNIPRTVKEGGTLAQVNGRFYATKGGNCSEFWEYDPAARPDYRWTQKADVPAGSAGVHSGASATGLQVGSSSYVYLLRASATCEFYRYDVTGDDWQMMATAPGRPGEEFKTGSSISFDGSDTIFALKGTRNEFYAYAVSSNTWLAKPDLPLGPRNKQAKGGAAICYHLRSVYCVKGGNSQEFWVYNCDDETWDQGPDLPLGSRKTRVQDGGALVFCHHSRYLFATKGNCLEFWSYGRLSNFGPMSPDQNPVGLSGRLPPYRIEVMPTVVTGQARITYVLPRAGHVELLLYDAAGRLTRTLVRGASKPGCHSVLLAASELAHGVYILRYRSGPHEALRKIIIE